jgi:hypothetical protein
VIQLNATLLTLKAAIEAAFDTDSLKAILADLPRYTCETIDDQDVASEPPGTNWTRD